VMIRPLFVTCMRGLGDTVYQRPFIRAQGEVRPVFADTPWPQLFADLPNVRAVRPVNMPYRTQAKNMARVANFPWSRRPAGAIRAQFTYALSRPGSICDELERHVGLAGRPFVFDLPDFGPSPVKSAKPIAVLRPVTTRAEWKNLARSPRPEYLEEAALILKAEGFHVVAIADIEPPAEWLDGNMPQADEYFVHGELAATELLALIQNAGVIVGGSGFIIPCGIASRTPLVVIGGGQSAYNAPARVTDPRMDLSRIRFVLPDRYCPCRDMKHACDKRIAFFGRRFRSALREAIGDREEVAA
jgi:hypothetical protein